MTTGHAEQPTKTPFPGFRSPNYTMVPDELFDDLMVDLSGAELKVLLYIIRRTYGFKKDSDNIALSQMLNGVRTRDGRVLDRGAGLSKKTLLAALRSLEEQQIIFTARRQSVEKGNEPTTYRLNVQPGSTRDETPPPLGEKVHQGGGGETPPSPRGRNSPTQETGQQQTDVSVSNLRMATANEVKLETRERPPVVTATQTSTPPHRAGPTAIGATLQERTPVRPREPRRFGMRVDPERDVIQEYISDLSREFGDRAPLRSSTSRAYNLYQLSGQPLEHFIERLYRARAVVKERTANIREGAPAEPGGLRRKNKMAYFFAVLEDLSGLRSSGEGSSDTTTE